MAVGLIIIISLYCKNAESQNEAVFLPDVTVCAGAEWDTQNLTQDSIVYTCRQICAEGWQHCTYTVSGETDHSGCLIPHLAFVVEGMGGELRWSCGGTTTLFIYNGMGGAEWGASGEESRELEKDGVRLVEVKWEGGVLLDGIRLGWFSRKNGNGTTIRELSGRPGAIIKWVHDNLSQNYTFGTAGCSGGGMATFSPVYWYYKELAPTLDYQFITGAALPWDVEAWCGVNRENEGRCENAPMMKCETDKDCIAPRGRCAYPKVTMRSLVGIAVRTLVDYIIGGGKKCVVSAGHPLMRESSYRYTPGSYDYNHKIDFDFGEGEPGEESLDDTLLGFTGNAAYIYEQLTGPKEWFDNDGYSHCASSGNPELVPITLDRIRKGLKLK
ncbi:MAG: hypothetical protein AB1546_12610 [bacterium]